MSIITTSAPLYLTSAEVAKRVGVDTTTIDEWSKTGAMPFAKRLGNALRWELAEIDEWDRTEFAARLRAADTAMRSAK